MNPRKHTPRHFIITLHEIKDKEKSKQNIARDIEIKNIVTIAAGERGRYSGERGL